MAGGGPGSASGDVGDGACGGAETAHAITALAPSTARVRRRPMTSPGHTQPTAERRCGAVDGRQRLRRHSVPSRVKVAVLRDGSETAMPRCAPSNVGSQCHVYSTRVVRSSLTVIL